MSDLISPDMKTTSLIIAEKFGKRHDDVLKRIDAFEIPEEYRLRNFAERVREVSHGAGQNREYKYYALTRDGFALLVMGFTGKRALAWKIKFLEAFNAMEAQLRASGVPLPFDPETLLQEAETLRRSAITIQIDAQHMCEDAARLYGKLQQNQMVHHTRAQGRTHVRAHTRRIAQKGGA
jgi:Rha family phage regulatory protein